MTNTLQFLPTPPDESHLYIGSYDPVWVIISVLLAIIASYAALKASARVERLHDTTSKLIWTLISAFTLGIGIWAMHFIGMMALSLPCSVRYNPLITLISMIPAILASGIALGVVWQHGTKHLSPLIGSLLLGAGIGTMHYTGMAAMQLEGFVRYDPSWFALSIIVAVGLSYLALRVKNGVVGLKKQGDVLVAVILGSAVSGMHYTAMSAAYFVRGDVGALPPSLFTTNALAILVAITTVFLALGALALASISRNREVTDKLRDSEQQFRQLSENIREVFWMTDPAKDKMLYISPAYEPVWGRTVQSLYDAPRTWLEAIHGEDRPRVLQAALTKQVAGLYDEEYRIVRPNGEVRWIRDQAFPVRDSEGNVYRIAGIAEDITEHKQAKMLSRERESQLHAIVESLTEGLAVSDLDGQLLHFNRAALDLHGFTTLDECRRRLLEFADTFELSTMDGTVLSLEQWPLSRILRGESLCDLELYVRHIQAGWQRVFNYGGTLAHDADDQPLVAIVTISDITERKQAEADLRIAATAIESHESLMITDANRVILRVNQAFTEDSGYTAEEVVGQTPRLLRSGRHKADFYHAMWETIHRTGSWQGEIWDRRKNGEIYPKWLTISAVKGENGVVTHYVGSHIDITERKAAEEKIQHLAFYDPLTRLANRRLLLDRLQQALASSARIDREGALLFIDLDNFKSLNDSLGHQIGDLLLQQTAQRLESCVRDGDTVARLGGDEFVVMLENLSEQPIEAAAQTEAIGEKIIAALNQPYLLAAHEYHGTASIGATLFDHNQQATDELMKQADIAMYQAKKAGRNALRFFDPQMQTSITARVSLEGELHKALEKQQFHLHYQIQVDSSNRPLGAEALIRWLHPERGLVSPAQFIPLAEETGLILPIGQWVLEAACTQLKTWQQEPLTRDLVLAVNVSAKQFRQDDFVAQVQAAIQRHAINPMRLKLELTEGMLLENIEDTIATMNALKEVGIQFSLDDFGTGYSCLQYLKRLPLAQLKIDQSFVRDIVVNSSDRAIVRTIIAMAQSLDLGIIAEGVETEEQRQLLLHKGCIHYQGYLFGRPVPIEQFIASLK